MITRVWFYNFKAIEKMSIDLGRFTVFVGPNGSGKTSVLDGIYLLKNAFVPRKIKRWNDAGIFEELLRKNANGPSELGMHLDHQQGQMNITIRWVREIDKTKIPNVRWWPNGIPIDEERAALPVDKPPGWFRQAMRETMLLRLEPQTLAEPSDSDVEVPAVTPFGEGLASVIADMILSEPDRLERILQQLRTLFPSIRRIRVGRAKLESDEFGDDNEDEVQKPRHWGHRVLLDTIHGDGIPLHQASEGVILALGLLTILNSKTSPRVLLWDDMDKAFHPKAQQDLIKLIRGILEEIPDLQILGTTHSPYLLDELSYDEVRVMATRDDGTPVCAPLKEHPEFERWKDDVKPGELWMSYLEGWVNQTRGTDK